ncbi:MAG: hypothetical protein AAFP19_00435 [Bacteroidota bacterium]
MRLRKRFLIHMILAIFIANAANKFFIGDLEYEKEHQFYGRILEFRGDAPDQYRIIPLLGIKVVWEGLKLVKAHVPFSNALLVFNFFCAFGLLEFFYQLMGHHRVRIRILFNLLFASLYIYTQYTGWRPDTLGLLFLCTAYCMYFPFARPGWRSAILQILGILVLSFSRSDMALIYGCFVAFYFEQRVWLKVCLVALPIISQLLLQFIIFPEATYYTTPIMILDNLKLYYLVQNPASWLILAFLLIFYNRISRYMKRHIYDYPFFYLLVGAYFGLVFIMGRVNEYRLYLPFIPLFMVIDREIRQVYP